MRIKTIIKCFLIVGLTAAFTVDGVSQKKSTGKRSPAQVPKSGTTSAKPTSSKQTVGPNLSLDDMKASSYFTYLYLEPQKELYTYGFLKLNADMETRWDLMGTTYGGDWSITGNKLNYDAGRGGRLKGNVSSSNGGLTFNGQVSNGSSVQPLFLVRRTGENMDPEVVKRRFKNNEYQALVNVEVQRENATQSFKAKIKFTPSDDSGNEGTFKITSDNKMATYIGVMKGEYTFTDEALIITGFDDEEDETPYDSWGNDCFQLALGDKNLPGYSNCWVTVTVYYDK